jgi:hypothetical protein
MPDAGSQMPDSGSRIADASLSPVGYFILHMCRKKIVPVSNVNFTTET